MGHLILQRETSQSVVCVVPPSDRETVIHTTIEEIRGGKVRVGTSAPDDVIVDREEIYHDKLRSKREMAARDAEKALTGKKVEVAP